MKTYKLKNYTRGWIIGDFDPSIITTKKFELKIHTYPKGFVDNKHVHKVSDEITTVVNGSCRVNKNEFTEGDIYWITPGEWADFEALENCTIVTVKIPSVKGDKHLQI